MDDAASTPLPGVLAVMREAGCVDDPDEDFKPKKRPRPDDERPVLPEPFPMRMCPIHPNSVLQRIPVYKPGPSNGRFFCESHAQ